MIINVLLYTLLAVTLISPLFHLAMSLHKPRKRKKRLFLEDKPQQGMTILVPCYNEQAILATTIEGLKNVDYENCEIIFINDDSKDKTFETLKILLDLESLPIMFDKSLEYEMVRGYYKSNKYPTMFVIDKKNGGKADSLNAGIIYANHNIIVTLDADTILEKNSLRIINQKFDDTIIAAGGYVRVLQGFNPNSRRKFSFNLKHIVRFQTLEYAKGFSILKQSLSKVNALMVISGAFGIFNRRVLMEVGGYRKTIGEDIDITLKFQEYIHNNPKYKMTFITEAVCYTECPENWKDLYKQRIRWQKAFIDCLIRYRLMLIKTVFTRSLSFFMISDALIAGTIASYVSIFSIFFLMFTPVEQWSNSMMGLLIYSVLINVLWNIVAFINGYKVGVKYSIKDLHRIVTTVIFDIFFFRFLSTFYIMIGTVLFFVNKDDWNKVTRTGTNYQIQQTEKVKQSA